VWRGKATNQEKQVETSTPVAMKAGGPPSKIQQQAKEQQLADQSSGQQLVEHEEVAKQRCG
jgi:hypothetical protein